MLFSLQLGLFDEALHPDLAQRGCLAAELLRPRAAGAHRAFLGIRARGGAGRAKNGRKFVYKLVYSYRL